MTMPDNADLPELARFAVATARRLDRPLFASLLALDYALEWAAAQAKEPLVTQIRLAWWRDELGKLSRGARPNNPTLEQLDRAWGGDAGRFANLVDAWEALAIAGDEHKLALDQLAQARAQGFVAIANRLGCGNCAADVIRAAQIWSFVDRARYGASDVSRDTAEAIAVTLSDGHSRLPRPMRPLAVLAGMARRSLARGGGHLLGDRISPFAATRIALIGR